MTSQISFAPNGNISPCPYKEDCINHPAGCGGESYWCERFDTAEARKQMRKAKDEWRNRRTAHIIF